MPPAADRRLLPARAAWIVAGMTVVTTWCSFAPAIEMFTFFGDGSRIGLPSLEVPIEAYPGIPLRSDRIRARRRAQRRGGEVPADPARARTAETTTRTMPAIEPYDLDPAFRTVPPSRSPAPPIGSAPPEPVTAPRPISRPSRP
jgi:hypothetical protein